MARLSHLTIDASIPHNATFGQAVEALRRSAAAVLAVIGRDERVVGLLDERQLLKGLFPAYLGELRHTAFAGDDRESIDARRAEAAERPVSEFMAAPTTVEADASLTHLAERLMHGTLEGVAVVEDGRYRGVIDLHSFIAAVLGKP